ncbi:MAG: YggS family pyridoxal phosphate-dependent enzyme [Microbacteriaceae bacterium]
MDSSPGQRWLEIDARIAAAALANNRQPDEITTIVVTKFHPASLVRELYEAGVRNVGENRHQEAMAKQAELSDLPLTWHFVGQLQSNKAKAVAQYCSVIHSVDRASLVSALASGEKPLDVFLEVNLTDVAHRGGVEPSGLLALAEEVLERDILTLRGLMAVAPLDQEPAAAFDRVLGLSQTLQSLAPGATDLSMGMSADFEEAIAAGATHLRIGSAITGKRPLAP